MIYPPNPSGTHSGNPSRPSSPPPPYSQPSRQHPGSPPRSALSTRRPPSPSLLLPLAPIPFLAPATVVLPPSIHPDLLAWTLEEQRWSLIRNPVWGNSKIIWGEMGLFNWRRPVVPTHWSEHLVQLAQRWQPHPWPDGRPLGVIQSYDPRLLDSWWSSPVSCRARKPSFPLPRVPEEALEISPSSPPSWALWLATDPQAATLCTAVATVGALAAAGAVLSVWVMGRGSSASSRVARTAADRSLAEALIQLDHLPPPVEVPSFPPQANPLPEASGELEGLEQHRQRCRHHRRGLEHSLVWTSWLLQSARLELELEEKRLQHRTSWLGDHPQPPPPNYVHLGVGFRAVFHHHWQSLTELETLRFQRLEGW